MFYGDFCLQFRNKTSLSPLNPVIFGTYLHVSNLHTASSEQSLSPAASSTPLSLPLVLLSALPLSLFCLPFCQHQLLLAAPSSEATFATPHTSPSGKSSPDEAAAGTLMKLGSAVLQGEGVPSPVTALSHRGQLTGHRHPCVVCATTSAVVQSCLPCFFFLLLTAFPLVFFLH